MSISSGRARSRSSARQRFHELEDAVWGLIEDEVKKSMASDRTVGQ